MATSGVVLNNRASTLASDGVVWQQPARSFGSRVSSFLRLSTPNRVAAAIERCGLPEVAGTPVEEARKLLHIAAAAEHALMVQYLYSAYSIDEDLLIEFQGNSDDFSPIGLAAVQEMGHLIAVQNLRLLVGEEPTFVRQDQAVGGDEYPFPYLLEPFSRASLAKYLIAESPSLRLKDLPPDVREFIRHALGKLDTDGDGLPDLTTRPVGLIYAKLFWLLQEDDRPAEWPDVAEAFSRLPAYRGRHIAEQDLSLAASDRQTVLGEWGNYAETRELTIDRDPVRDRAGARRLLHAIAVQGEGYDDDAASHFRSFARLQTFLSNWRGRLSRPWPTAPTLAADGPGQRITHPPAAALAAIANAVYETLLYAILAGLSVPRDPPGKPKERSALFKRHAYELMGLIGRLARQTGALPLGDPAEAPRAAMTFELASAAEVLPGGAVAAAAAAVARSRSIIAAATDLDGDEQELAQHADGALDRLATTLSALQPKISAERE